jgi:putative FmdB family regulatory protein
VPTYDYVCTSCGHEMEIMHSLHAHGPDACPLCGAPMKKTFGVPTVHFKGTGWARKDRATAKPAKVGPKDPGSSAASEAGSGSGGSTVGSSDASASSAQSAPSAEKGSD